VTLVVLDIGATLVAGPDSAPWSRLAMELELEPAEKAMLRESLMTRAFSTPTELAAFLADGLGLGNGAGASLPAIERLWAAQAGESRPLPGAAAALERLHAAGLRLAVLSNIWLPYLASVRTHFGGLFDRCIAPELQLFSFEQGLAKPAPELFARVLERARTKACEAVMVGDSYVEDIAPALSLGMGTVWVLHRPERERPAIAAVLNAEEPAPAVAIASIADLDAGTVGRALALSAERTVGDG
jgi:HAD superfamily hydrolase (TIGR01509 family)